MLTAIDTSVLMDVISADPVHADSSERALREATQQGGLAVGECVIAEISPSLTPGEMSEFLKDWRLQFVPSSLPSALLAGEMFSLHLKRGGARRRILADFLIGAHAQFHAQRLLVRDRGYLRDYFKHLKIWDPSAAP